MIFLRKYRHYTIIHNKIRLKIGMIENERKPYNTLVINLLVIKAMSNIKDPFILDMPNKMICIMNRNWEVEIDDNTVNFVTYADKTCYLSYILNRTFVPNLQYKITIIIKYDKNGEIKQYYITNYGELAIIKLLTYEHRLSTCIV